VAPADLLAEVTLEDCKEEARRMRKPVESQG
jgi:hypothetical protein